MVLVLKSRITFYPILFNRGSLCRHRCNSSRVFGFLQSCVSESCPTGDCLTITKMGDDGESGATAQASPAREQARVWEVAGIIFGVEWQTLSNGGA